MKYLKWTLCIFALLYSINALSQCTGNPTLQAIIKRGYLMCGVSEGLAGFSTVDDKGQWTGIDVDFCAAVAAATLGDATKVKYVPLTAKERFTSLQTGGIDLLSRNTTWTISRDLTLGLTFTGVVYYDGQGFIVPKNSKIKSLKDLNNAIICTNAGTTSELNIADYFQSHNLKYQILTFEKTDETLLAYETGRCDTYTTDVSALAAQRLKLANKDNHIILDERISKEPLGPVVRAEDHEWEKMVQWVLFAMVNAEELQVNRANVQSKINDIDPKLERLFGKQGNIGEKIGLKNDWAFQVIKQVGNYADIFDKNVGKDSPLKLERGLNALWNQGGIQYAPPFR